MRKMVNDQEEAEYPSAGLRRGNFHIIGDGGLIVEFLLLARRHDPWRSAMEEEKLLRD
jgi:hypothetical protein